MMTMEAPPTPASPVERAIAALLIENTGSSMLDSGGAYGRAWQWTRAKYGLDGGLPNSAWHGGPGHRPEEPEPDDLERVALAMREEPAGEIDSYGMIGVDTFHYLVDRLDYDPRLDAKFRRFVDKLWQASQNSRRPDYGEARIEWPYETGAIERFIEQLRVHGADVEINESDNSYNHENVIDRTIQYTIFTVSNPSEWGGEIRALSTHSVIGPVVPRATEFLPDGGYVALQIHGGADVRGGYTDAHLFTISEPWPFGDIDRFGVYCEGADLVPGGACPGQITLEAEVLEPRHVSHYWDNSYGDGLARRYDSDIGDQVEEILVLRHKEEERKAIAEAGVIDTSYDPQRPKVFKANVATYDDEAEVWRCPFDDSPLGAEAAIVG